MTAVRSLIDASMAVQSAALLGENVRVARKALDFSKTKRRSRSGAQLKNMVGLGVTNVVGISLIKAQGELAQGL